MITLYQFSPIWGLPNISPFCLKMETYLRMAKLPFQIKYVNNPKRAPKGKLPFIKDNGQIIADSSLIIDYLKDKYGVCLDQNLTASQKAQALALQRLVEEHLYWAAAYARWLDPQVWEVTRKAVFAKVPVYLRWLIERSIQKRFRQQIYQQGIGRHTPTEIYQMANADITAIATLLGDKQFFFGDQPSSIDTVLYGFLANIIVPPVVSPLKKHTVGFENLVNYCDRIKKLYY